jgi:perosamine synthetase
MIPVFAPWLSENVRRYVLDCVDSGWISSLGQYVGRFEHDFATFCEARHAVATSNGTTALHLCLATLGIGPGDEVLVPDLTFVSTANVVRYTGATPVLVDSEPRTWGMDAADARRKLTARTRAIIPVHLYGHPVDMDPLLAMAAEHRLDIVEDAAEAHGARYKGQRVGALGRIGAFSFYGNKIITTGEGGMVVTNDPALAERAAFLRDHAMDPRRRYFHPEIGFNYRMTNIQAAIGCAQLEQVDAILARRKAIAAAYETGLAGILGLTRPPAEPWAESVYWMYSVLIEPAFGSSREAVIAGLRARGVDSRPFFVPLHELPPYHLDTPFPVATSLGARGINLPSGTGLILEEINTVCGALRALSAG